MKLMKSVDIRIFAVLLFMFSPWVSASPGIGHIEVGNARIFLPVAGAEATSTKMTIYNRSDKPLIINQVVGKAFKQVMFHQTQFEGGQRTMKPVKQFNIDAHAQMALTPNTAHIMLMGLSHTLQKGELITLVLKTNQGNVSVIARVTPMHLR